MLSPRSLAAASCLAGGWRLSPRLTGACHAPTKLAFSRSFAVKVEGQLLTKDEPTKRNVSKEKKLASKAEQKRLKERKQVEYWDQKRNTWWMDRWTETRGAGSTTEVSASASSGQMMPKVADFSSRQAIRHLLGLPNGSAPPLEIPGGAPLFLCIDLEAWEFDQKLILELGVTKLDLKRSSTYPNCDPWKLLKHMVYEHNIIRENRHRKNKKFSPGCPDMFLFGESGKLSAESLSAKYRKFPNENDIKNRPILLVGHDLPNDERYLATLGIRPRSWPNLVGVVDTQKIARKESFPLNLEKMLAKFQVPTPWAHNAGNDAAYTMHALLLFALYKDEWKSPEAIDRARSFLKQRQRLRIDWDDEILEGQQASLQKAKLAGNGSSKLP